jgi:biopolymer transport protein ExbD
MTETIPVNSTNKRPGYPRRKTRSPRIDMTPMVDLGFLLITFFIFTSTLNQPNAMSLVMPKDGDDDTPIKETGALTILAGDQMKVYYYEGFYDPSNVRSCTLKDLRNIIVHKKRVTPEKDLFVIIKPFKNADY